MKRFVIIAVTIMMLFLCGCTDNAMADIQGGFKSAEQYKAEAMECVDNGDVRGAMRILREGIDNTGSRELADMLEMLESVSGNKEPVLEAEKTQTDRSEAEPVVEVAEPEAEVAEPEVEVAEPETEAAEPAYRTNTVNLLDGMTASEVKNVVLFLSNFSEARVSEYDRDKLEEYTGTLLWFAFEHNSINNTGRLNWTHSYDNTEFKYHDYMSESDVDTTLMRYFGVTVPRESTEYYIYSGGNFYTPSADGVSAGYFSIPTYYCSNEDGTYTIEFSVFFNEGSLEGPFPEWYDYTYDEAMRKFKHFAVGEAVVSRELSGSKEVFKLLKYTTQKL